MVYGSQPGESERVGVDLDGTATDFVVRAIDLLERGAEPDSLTFVANEASVRAAQAIEPDVHELGARLLDAKLPLPKGRIERLLRVAAHDDPQRWSLLYRMLWDVRQGGTWPVEDEVEEGRNPGLAELERDVRREVYQARAFLRFEAVAPCEHTPPQHEGYHVAWFASRFAVLPLVARFFTERFATLRFAIATPQALAAWDGARLYWHAGTGDPHTPPFHALLAEEGGWLDVFARWFRAADATSTDAVSRLPGAPLADPAVSDEFERGATVVGRFGSRVAMDLPAAPIQVSRAAGARQATDAELRLGASGSGVQSSARSTPVQAHVRLAMLPESVRVEPEALRAEGAPVESEPVRSRPVHIEAEPVYAEPVLIESEPVRAERVLVDGARPQPALPSRRPLPHSRLGESTFEGAVEPARTTPLDAGSAPAHDPPGASAAAVPARIEDPAEAFLERLAACRRCSLCGYAGNAVAEAPDPCDVLFVLPETEENAVLSGDALALLEEITDAIGLRGRWRVTAAVRNAGNPVQSLRSSADACRPWLEQEVALASPVLVVALGSIAARSVFRRHVDLASERGTFLPTRLISAALATWDPRRVVRQMPDTLEAQRNEMFSDLARCVGYLARHRAP